MTAQNTPNPADRYFAALHGIQAAIAWNMAHPDGPHGNATQKKHMRVGIDSAHISQFALVELLIAKGFFTRAEFVEALASAAESELAGHERDASDYSGVTISFR